MARKDGSKKIIPFEIFAEEFARENFARGGMLDIEVEEGYTMVMVQMYQVCLKKYKQLQKKILLT